MNNKIKTAVLDLGTVGFGVNSMTQKNKDINAENQKDISSKIINHSIFDKNSLIIFAFIPNC